MARGEPTGTPGPAASTTPGPAPDAAPAPTRPAGTGRPPAPAPTRTAKTGSPPAPAALGGLTALLCATALVTLTACSGPADNSGATGTPGVSSLSGTASAPPPGKYQTLPEPCGSVSQTTLHALLPASQNYAGDATLTYDTDRRAGCKWTGMAQGANRQLVIDFERVVSYDSAVSDEDKAQREFERKATAAHIPDNAPDPHDTAAAPGTPGASSPPAGGGGDTSPRRVGGIGDQAYLDDALLTEDDGLHRDVTIVFRIANVLVTVDFSQWSADASVAPAGFELQLGAHGLAQALAKTITE